MMDNNQFVLGLATIFLIFGAIVTISWHITDLLQKRNMLETMQDPRAQIILAIEANFAMSNDKRAELIHEAINSCSE